MKSIDVVAGIIIYKNRILCVQKPESKQQYISKKFEFPGGKIEAGESHTEALSRELLEELNLSTVNQSYFLTVVHQYPNLEVTLHAYLCQVDSDVLILHEHISRKWLKAEELGTLDWAAADIPIVEKLMTIKSLDSIGIKAKK